MLFEASPEWHHRPGHCRLRDSCAKHAILPQSIEFSFFGAETGFCFSSPNVAEDARPAGLGGVKGLNQGLVATREW